MEKIKRERAEEKVRLEQEQSASAAASREVEVATANPLLNLAAALGQAPGINTTVPGTFQVKKRWDDGNLITSSVGYSELCMFYRSYFQESGYGPKASESRQFRQ